MVQIILMLSNTDEEVWDCSHLVLVKSGTGLFPVSPTSGRTFQRDISIDVYGIYSGFDTLSLGLCLREYPKNICVAIYQIVLYIHMYMEGGEGKV